MEGGALGKFVRMPGWVHNSGHLGIREPWRNQQAPSYCLLLLLVLKS